jgi:hypothetical protein
MATSRLIGPTFADPDAAARQPSPAPKRRRLGRHSFRPATARSELAGNLETDRRGPVAITDVGEAQSIPIELQNSLLDFVVANLPGPEGRILKTPFPMRRRQVKGATRLHQAATPTREAHSRPRIGSDIREESCPRCRLARSILHPPRMTLNRPRVFQPSPANLSSRPKALAK